MVLKNVKFFYRLHVKQDNIFVFLPPPPPSLALCARIQGWVFLLHAFQSVKTVNDSQGETLVPHRVECGADGLGLLFAVALRVRNQFEFDIGVRQAVWIHGHQVASFAHWRPGQ